ncbi:hypothetical protein [Rhodoferax lacus]|uniref:hypothetical protein n=1 Tax=Rhodoferax lacus TaxID=2184758 RepID=UPI0011C19836|nr:hypothetical protein [Rhodoferax lacus]
MNPSLLDNPLYQGLILLAAGLLLVLLLVWVAYRAIKAAVRDGIREARQVSSQETWLPTERQSL